MEVKPEVLKQSIQALLRLQEIDGQVFKLVEEEKNLPPEMQSLNSKIAEATKAFQLADKAFKDADRDRRALELKNLTMTEDAKRAETKRQEVRNTKEEFSANKEVDNFRKRIHDVKAALEEKTTIAGQRNQVREEKQKALTDLQEAMKKLETDRNQRLESVRANIQTLENQRDEYISKVDEDIFSLYERVQKIRKGSGIALMDGDICQGCFVTIPPHTRLQLVRMESVITCSSCSRILFPAEELSGQSPTAA